MGRRNETVELTVLCLIQNGEKILLQNRIKEDWKGYTLPGGHVETGESFVDAVMREMKEETGLTMLDKDRNIAKSENLSIEIVKGNMCDLSCFPDNSFDLVVSPPSLMYVHGKGKEVKNT